MARHGARHVGIALACIVCLGCDPVRSRSIALHPQPPAALDSARALGLRAASETAAHMGLEQFAPRHAVWAACFRHDDVLTLCGKEAPSGLEFHISSFGGWSALADATWKDLVATLRREFGDSAVFECTWHPEPRAGEDNCRPSSNER